MIERRVQKSMQSMSEELKTAEDPTKAILSESSLHSKHLCDYVINVATGCRHGCKFCYVPSTPNIRARPEMLESKVDVENSQREWGSYVLYRDGLGERLRNHLDRKRTWTETEFGQGIVGISFSTDCYMDGRAGKITRNVIRALADHQKYTRVLTRNPILALQDLETFKQAGEYVTIGSSIPSLDADWVSAIEPDAPAPQHRLRGLEKFNDHGVRTFVSISPTYPTMERSDLRRLLERVAESDPDVIFHEPINPRAGNFAMTVQAARDAGELELANALEQLRDRETWIKYAISHLRQIQLLGQELDLPIHLWPDEQLVERTDGAVSEWLSKWKSRQSVEDFARRPDPEFVPVPPVNHRSQ